MTRSDYRFADSRQPHFVTSTVVAWLPIFTRPAAVEIVLDSWRFWQRTGRITLFSLRPREDPGTELTRGYVDDPLHWRYSSARNYASQSGLIDVCTDW